MLWLANNWPIISIVSVMVIVAIVTARDYVKRKSDVLGRAYK